MPGRKIVIAGGTGFVGRHLIASLVEAREEVVVLTRGASTLKGVETVSWDGKTVGSWASELESCFAIINFAGASINQHWSESAKGEILESRVQSAKAIGQAIQAAKKPPLKWLNASATGFYGDRGDLTLDESASAGGGFLPEVCTAWEAAVAELELPQTQRCIFRLGVVLGDGGMLKALGPVVRAGLGGKVGKGSQYMSWVHVEDVTGMLRYLLDAESPPRLVNATAPSPVTNKEFMRTLRGVLRMPIGLPTPEAVFRAFASTVGPGAETVLDSTRAVPAALLQSGYRFKFPELKAAIQASFQ